jgi:mannonate dehydratase
MKIDAARVVVCCPGRNFVTLILHTADGVTGYGDATLNGRELAVASYLQEHVIALLIGSDASAIEDTWQMLYRGAYWRGGAVTMTAIAAVDMALWDIKAKYAGMPLYQLLGGRSRERLLVYGHANGRDIEETVDAVATLKEEGYAAIRVQCGIPGLKKTYGVSAPGSAYEPASGHLPDVQAWDTASYMRHMPKLFEALRLTFGDDLHLLHDVHHRLSPNEGAQLGRWLEPYRLFWLEDVTPVDNPESLRRVRAQTTTPLAIGEVLSSLFACKPLIQEQLIDYIRTSIVHAGGVTHWRRIAEFAAVFQVRTGCHGATDLSPITMGCALHAGTWVPNFGIQEHMPHPSLVQEVFAVDYRFESGYMYCGQSPGHGVTFNETAAQRFPYKRAYLPVNRLASDGSVWDW